MNTLLLNENPGNSDHLFTDQHARMASRLVNAGEEFSYLATQDRSHYWIASSFILVSNQRMLFCRPKLLGFQLAAEEVKWEQIASVHLERSKGLFKFITRLKDGKEKALSGLTAEKSRFLYLLSSEVIQYCNT